MMISVPRVFFVNYFYCYEFTFIQIFFSSLLVVVNGFLVFAHQWICLIHLNCWIYYHMFICSISSFVIPLIVMFAGWVVMPSLLFISTVDWCSLSLSLFFFVAPYPLSLFPLSNFNLDKDLSILLILSAYKFWLC